MTRGIFRVRFALMSMKRFSICCLRLAFALAAGTPWALVHAAPAEVAATPEKAKAPDWELTDLEGQPLRSSDFKGKVLVVDFWATWCAPCVSEIPGYIELQKKYEAQGLAFVGLSLDAGGPDVVRKFVKAHKVNYPVGLAGDQVQAAFGGFEAIPTTFVIGRDGRIAYKKTGAMKKSEFEEILKPLLK